MAQAWAWAALIVLSGTFGIENQAAMFIVLTIVSLSFSISVGYRHAAYELVRDTLNEGNVPLAKDYTYLAFSLGFPAALTLAGILIVFKSQIVDLFSNDEKIAEIAEGVIPLVCLTNIFDLIVACFQGYLRGVDPEDHDWIEPLTDFVRAPSLYGRYTALKVFVFFLVFGGSAILYTLTLEFEDLVLWLSYELAIFFLFLHTIISIYSGSGAKMAQFSVKKFQDDQFEGGEFEPLLKEDLEFAARMLDEDKPSRIDINIVDPEKFIRKPTLAKFADDLSDED